MGEIADMELEGILCQDCGRFMGPGPGEPISCKGCEKLKKLKVDRAEKAK